MPTKRSIPEAKAPFEWCEYTDEVLRTAWKAGYPLSRIASIIQTNQAEVAARARELNLPPRS